MTRLQCTLAPMALVLALASATTACSKTTPEPEKASEPPTPVPSSVAPSRSTGPVGTTATATGGPDDIAYDAPKSWETAPNANPMRKATFKIPKTGGDVDDAELTVSAASGGVDANIKRWAGQFGNAEPKTEQRTVNGLKITVVEIKGPFASGGGMMGAPSTPKEKQMLLGAVVDAGDRQHFFKMTGPEKTVSAAKKDFDAFVSSFRAK